MRIRTKKTYYYLESLIRERFNLFGTDIYIKFPFNEIPIDIVIQLKIQNNKIITEEHYD